MIQLIFAGVEREPFEAKCRESAEIELKNG